MQPSIDIFLFFRKTFLSKGRGDQGRRKRLFLTFFISGQTLRRNVQRSVLHGPEGLGGLYRNCDRMNFAVRKHV